MPGTVKFAARSSNRNEDGLRGSWIAPAQNAPSHTRAVQGTCRTGIRCHPSEAASGVRSEVHLLGDVSCGECVSTQARFVLMDSRHNGCTRLPTRMRGLPLTLRLDR